jgi:predicted MFS family arabinose efflux permease
VMAAVDGGGGLLLGTIVLSVGISLNYPSLMALTLNSVPDDERPAVVPTFTAFFEVGTAAGGLALGPVADHAGYQAAFAAGGAAMFVGVAVLWFFVIVPRRIVLLAAHR